MDSLKKQKDYLDTFINYEKEKKFSYKKVLCFKRVEELFRQLDIRPEKLKTIHIAGTKGKGSVAYFSAYIFSSLKDKVGLYTSPHLFSNRERIQIIKSSKSKTKAAILNIKTELILKKDLNLIAKRFKNKLDSFKIPEELGKISFFEIFTAIAFRYFFKKRVDVAIFETGLGGRLDATNMANPSVSIITHIGFDHTDKLGKTLKAISREKAGIIKENTPLICSYQEKEALDVIKETCQKKKAFLYLLGRDFKAKNIRIKRPYTSFDFKFKDVILKNIKIKLKGRHQVENAACAILAAILLRKNDFLKSKKEVKNAMSLCEIPARFEVFKKKQLFVFDVAHNLSSFSVLGRTLKTYFPRKKVILIFSCASDKKPKQMLKKINYRHLIFTELKNIRSFLPLELKKICNIKNVCLAADVTKALEIARSLYKNNSLILIGGSFHLVAQVKKAMKISGFF